MRFSWDFGDGSRPKRARRPRRKYKVAGTFVTSLTVSDRKEDGLTDSHISIVASATDSLGAVTATEVVPTPE